MNDKLDKLLSQDCTQLSNENSAMNLSQIEELRQAVPLWQYCANENVLEQTYRFSRYSDTIDFMNLVANIAEQQNHHPDMLITHNRCKVSYSTHSVNGVTINDFICAAKIDEASMKK